MSQLAPLDAVFLSLDTPGAPAQIGGLAILDPRTTDRFDFERFRDFAASRVVLCPRFTWRIRQVPLGLDLPYWVEHPEFDVADHIHRAALPVPGGTHELAELAGHLFSLPLDHGRPLWEMFLIEGLQGGRVALLWKVHHCLMDGVSGAGLVELLFDVEPEPAARPLAVADDEADVGPAPGWREMIGAGLRNAGRRRRAVGRHLLGAAKAALAANAEGAASFGEAPRTSFNGSVGSRRSLAWSSVSLSDVQGVKRQLDVSVNDVILALTGASVRRYLEHRDELPDASLVALMPMSLRVDGDDSIGNQVGEVAVHWATDVEDPIERLLSIHAATGRAKRNAANGAMNLVGTLAETVPPAVTRLATRFGAAFADRVPLPGNAVVSNVRMTPFPLYMAGAKIAEMVPMSVLAPTQGLNITAISYCDTIYFGITVDPGRVPEPWLLAEGIPKALVELQQEIGASLARGAA